jgi:uncharacterized protein YdeI (YjbR/CyaY-like superfamily)
MRATAAAGSEIRTLQLADREAWRDWLDAHHRASRGVWLRLAKSGSGVTSVAYAEALEVALCYGWIDGQKRRGDDRTWLQKFTPRAPRSLWSKRNRETALALIAKGAMQAAGLAEVERARQDGRWDAAYDGPAGATVPADLQAALAADARAQEFFATLDSRNRYAVLFRVHNAKKPETRAKRIREYVEMLARGETLYP